MLRMVSHPHRPQSGHITCYLNRTYHVLPTMRTRRPWKNALSVLTFDSDSWSRGSPPVYSINRPNDGAVGGLCKRTRLFSGRAIRNPRGFFNAGQGALFRSGWSLTATASSIWPC